MKQGQAPRVIQGILLTIMAACGIAIFRTSNPWFWTYVEWAWVFPTWLSFWIGLRKGRSLLGLLLGMFISWIGVIIMMIVTQAKTASTHRECPHCRVVIRKDASVCPNCHRDISPSL